MRGVRSQSLSMAASGGARIVVNKDERQVAVTSFISGVRRLFLRVPAPTLRMPTGTTHTTATDTVKNRCVSAVGRRSTCMPRISWPCVEVPTRNA
ncbi:hypothetical protein CGRA01v4_00532 [Colletotrichum graminicola]|nr:hypothetical protein CGRA01v4_00532 [Colletotrichum graminicola]